MLLKIEPVAAGEAGPALLDSGGLVQWPAVCAHSVIAAINELLAVLRRLATHSPRDVVLQGKDEAVSACSLLQRIESLAGDPHAADAETVGLYAGNSPTDKIDFTSGSTGNPKGVCLSLGQCLAAYTLRGLLDYEF